MHARPADPRDQTFEVADPHYRVFFWASATHSEEWELTETDLDEVLDWISQNSRGRPRSLWAATENEDGVGHIRLRGIDPTAPADNGRLGRSKRSSAGPASDPPKPDGQRVDPEVGRTKVGLTCSVCGSACGTASGSELR